MLATVAFPDFSPPRSLPSQGPFVCTLSVGDPGPSWVHVRGALDLRGAVRLEQALRHTEGHGVIILDLREMTCLDSAGASVIIDAATRSRAAQDRLMLVTGPKPVHRALRLAAGLGVLEFLVVDPPRSPTRAPSLHPQPNGAA